MNYRNIVRPVIPTIIKVIMIMLIAIIINQTVTSISLTQVKLSFVSNIFPVIFISITASHCNTLQPEMLIFLRNSPTTLPNFQTITESPTFHQMSSTELTNFITSATSLPSSSKTPHLSPLKFQPKSSLPLPLLLLVTSSPRPTAHPCSSIYIPSSSRTSSKVLPATSDSSLYLAQHITEEIQLSPPVVPHVHVGTFEPIKNSKLRKGIPKDALSEVHVNKCRSYFKFILLLQGEINLNAALTNPKRNDML